jgi:hypothetical protein
MFGRQQRYRATNLFWKRGPEAKPIVALLPPTIPVLGVSRCDFETDGVNR